MLRSVSSPAAATTNGRFLRRGLLPALIAMTWVTPAFAADLLTIARDALNNNSELGSVRAQSQSVEAGLDVQRGDLLPQVNLRGNAAHTRQFESQTQSSTGGGADFGNLDESQRQILQALRNNSSASVNEDNVNSVSFTLEATQALFDAIDRREVERSEREIDQQVYVLAATEQQVLINVSSAYFDILRAYDVLEARLAQERAIGRQLEQAREQFEVGLIAITEVEEAQARFDQSRAIRIAAESDLQVSFEALERLTGKRYSSIEALDEEFPVVLPTPAGRDLWVEMAITNNPLILAEQAGVEVSKSSVNIAKALRLPSVDAFASYQYADNDADGIQGHDATGELGVKLDWPIYTGGSTQASIRQSTYRLEASQFDFEAQRRETVQQVRSLYTQVSNDVSTVEARQQAIVSNRSALDATRAGYEVGTRNIVDVLNAEQNLYNAFSDYAQARYDYVINLLSLHQQSGILDVEVINELNDWLRGDSITFTLPEDSAEKRSDSVTNIGNRPRLDDR
ncbi:TolC family outer membrane protein [Vreelandella rituensis]|uniref:Type I secretion protein TolC n=1 Tax=Vreelandella rituensis TaxID=2282306 RepID=A0A368U7K7_9GAMM|nr:TolC family outer membrane protein [Halomonas rituensis]RCV92965.1 type I secretion protein TolC [Halomonas rituensis]